MLKKLEMSDGGIRKDTLSNRMLRAALLVSEDRLTDEQIAEQAGVKRNALAKWKRREDFKAEIERIQTAARDQGILREGIALKVNRLRRLDKHAQEIEAKKEKVEDNKEFAALSKQYLDTLEQAAKEMGGQFEDQPDKGATANDNRKVIFNFPVATPELLAEVANAPTIDLPTARPRLLTRPSDGKQI